MNTVSIETLRADLKCAWEWEALFPDAQETGDWIYGIGPESMNTLKELQANSCSAYTLQSLGEAVMRNQVIAPVKVSDKVLRLVTSLKSANAAALLYQNAEDSGTCNLDSPVIRLAHWKESEVKQVSLLSGIDISRQLSGYWRGYRFVSTAMHGQAGLRTKMAETAKMHLAADGFDVAMYYQMD